jgi:hypothetical protein
MAVYYIMLCFSVQEQEQVRAKHMVGNKAKVQFTLEQAAKVRGGV